jgi:hypothetical protein
MAVEMKSASSKQTEQQIKPSCFFSSVKTPKFLKCDIVIAGSYIGSSVSVQKGNPVINPQPLHRNLGLCAKTNSISAVPYE